MLHDVLICMLLLFSDLPHLIQKALPEKPEASSDEDDTKGNK